MPTTLRPFAGPLAAPATRVAEAERDMLAPIVDGLMEELGFDSKKGLMGMMPHLADKIGLGTPDPSGENTEDAGDPSEAAGDDK